MEEENPKDSATETSKKISVVAVPEEAEPVYTLKAFCDKEMLVWQAKVRLQHYVEKHHLKNEGTLKEWNSILDKL